ncbi:MAG: urease accessory protein [Gammaproteobacteria bacterium]
MSISLLLLGFMLGMRHAFEADHVAAVASLASRSSSVRDGLRQGAVWGVGHTLTLFVFGSMVLLMDSMIPERLAQGLEFAVGVMLVLLGIDVLWRVIHERVHFHVHRHDNGTRHFHAHSHSNEQGHPAIHRHQHPAKDAFPLRALFVGLMHGMAGSAALILLTLQAVDSPWTGMVYIALFGVGSMAGMAVLSFVIAIPLRYSAAGLTGLHNGLRLVIGMATLIVGSQMVYQVVFVGNLLI